MRASWALVLFLLVSTSGCQSVFGNLFKNDYWDEIHRQSNEDEKARLSKDPATSYFLGIRTSSREQADQIGVVVSGVYAESPAAKAGLRAGDELRAINRARVRTPAEARLELTRLYREESELHELIRKAMGQLADDDPYVPGTSTRLVYARAGREIEVQVALSTREGYLDLRRKRVLDLSHYEEAGTNGFYFWKTRTLSPEFVEDYFGVTPAAEVRVAQDLDILPVAFGISLFRLERVPVASGTRVTVLSSLLQVSSRGDDVARSLEGLIPDPPAGSTDL